MNLGMFFIVSSCVIGALTLTHSLVYLKDKSYRLPYYLVALLTLVFSVGVFSATDLVVLLIFWGSLLILLYGILAFGSFQTGYKALVIVGIGDFCLLLGMVLLIAIRGGDTALHFTPLPTDNLLHASAFLCIAFGAMIKAGIFGFHEWIVDAAETNPTTTMAFLPASLDKFLGIYLLVRACKDFFMVNESLALIVMAVGAVTVLLAVLMALVQHDLKKLLAYHAVSQVGYMILGIASGTVIGIIGGLFHMLNNTIYKTSLFLNAGNIQYRTGVTDLDRLGGLNRLMPVTFLGTLIASLAIAGVPPLNGFASKWMIYQGLLPQHLSMAGGMQIAFLLIAMFGSALTLASFIKVIYAVFLSPAPEEQAKDIKEVPFLMQVPVVVLSLACVVLGVFFHPLAIKGLISPALGFDFEPLGVWQSDLATGLLFLGILFGAVIYWLGRTPRRETGIFIGGEHLEGNRVTGTDFYLTVQDLKLLRIFFSNSQQGRLNINRWLVNIIRGAGTVLYFCIDRLTNTVTNGTGKFVFVISAGFKAVHTGLLDRYVAWILLGLVVIMGVLYKCLSCM